MKRKMLLFIVLVGFSLSLTDLNADCNSLTKEVNKLKVYNESVAPANLREDAKMGVSIENLSENLYVVISNSYNDRKVTVKYEDTEKGNYWYRSPNIYLNVKVTVEVYSNDSTCIETNPLKTYEATTDVFNQYYLLNICQENLDLDECQPFVDNESVSKQEFQVKIDKAREAKDNTFLNKAWDFIKKYYLYVLIPIILISLVGITRIILLKRRKENE